MEVFSKKLLLISPEPAGDPDEKDELYSGTVSNFSLSTGYYYLELVGAGAGGAEARSWYTSDGKNKVAAYASTGGGSGAAFAGIIHLTSGTYSMQQGSGYTGTYSYAYSSGTAKVWSSSAPSSASSYLSKSGTALITCYGGGRGYAWADYNENPYYTGDSSSGGTVSVSDSSILVVTDTRTSGNSGSFHGGRITSGQASTKPIPAPGAEGLVYQGKGAGSWGRATLANAGYAKIYSMPYYKP